MVKKLLIIIVSAMTLIMIPITVTATDKTRDEALAWLQSQVGNSLDYDGAYGAQCVDLIKFYYAYLGVEPVLGNGCDYATNPLPAGWQRIQGAAPEPGDILVYSASGSNPAGHVAVYESDYAHYNQNVRGKYGVVKCTWHYAAYEPYWGVIRPNFADHPISSSVSVTTTNAQNVSETNATVYGVVSYSGSRPSEVGIYFGTSPDSMSKVARDSINHNKNPFDMWYDLNGEAGQYLSPGTTYYWQCYAVSGGNETRGDVKSFTTPGPTGVSVSVTTTDAQNISETNATVYGVVSYSGSRPSEVGIYFGTSPESMSKVARDSINHNKNPFDMWYDLNGEAGQYLSPGTTYYWQCYAIADGNETKGEIKSFVSDGTVATPTPIPTPIPTPDPTPTPQPEIVQVSTPSPIQTSLPDTSKNSVLTVFGGNTLQIAIDDRMVRFGDALPFIDSNNRTQVPVRAVSEMLGCNVNWVSETSTVSITSDKGDSVIIVIGSNIMLLNGHSVKMDTKAMIKDDRTYIPVRFVAEALGLTVEWI